MVVFIVIKRKREKQRTVTIQCCNAHATHSVDNIEFVLRIVRDKLSLLNIIAAHSITTQCSKILCVQIRVFNWCVQNDANSCNTDNNVKDCSFVILYILFTLPRSNGK